MHLNYKIQGRSVQGSSLVIASRIGGHILVLSNIFAWSQKFQRFDLQLFLHWFCEWETYSQVFTLCFFETKNECIL